MTLSVCTQLSLVQKKLGGAYYYQLNMINVDTNPAA